jgi:hypothetical protein
MTPHLAQFVLSGILAQHPWLIDHECRGCPAVEASDFLRAYDWLIEQPKPVSSRRSCYSLKHEAERGEHIGERAFIAAGIAAGYRVKLRNNVAFLTH